MSARHTGVLMFHVVFQTGVRMHHVVIHTGVLTYHIARDVLVLNGSQCTRHATKGGARNV